MIVTSLEGSPGVGRWAVLVLAAALAPPAAGAPGVERWTAVSTTAMAITGDITLSPQKLVAAGKTFPLTVAADVTAFGTATGPKAARILKVTVPADPVLLHGNTLCGSPIRWIVVYRGDGGKELNLAASGGDAMPMAESDRGVCGTFLYAR